MALASPRVWLITGASSGFGKGIVELALSNGDSVVATLRKPEVLKELQERVPAERLLVLKVDVTQPEDIILAFAKAKDVFGQVDVVFNNAGYGLLSEVEGTPDEVARKNFETNFWGAANVTREAVRFFREANPAGSGGRLINVSSCVGATALPCIGYYGASKHALEAITQSLSQELDPAWNIKVSLVLPGTCRTNAVAAAARELIHPAYDNGTSGAALFRKAYESLDELTYKVGDARKVVEKFYALSLLPEPPLRLVIGEDSIGYIRAQLASISADIDKYEDWSADVKEA